MDDKVTDPGEPAAVTNDVEAARSKADTEIKALFDVERDGLGALTEVGGVMAQACVDGAYSPNAKEAARRVYDFRRRSSKPWTKSDVAQASKLSNFAAVGLGWNRHGIELVKALVKRTEGLNDRYRHVQTVLVMLKRRAHAKEKLPSIDELVAMLKEARARKPRKARRPMSDSATVRKMDAWIKASDTPKDVVDACAVVRKFAASKVANVTRQVTLEPPANAPVDATCQVVVEPPADVSPADAELVQASPADGLDRRDKATDLTPGGDS